MGDPKKQRKKYEAPKHPWRMDQLEAELKLVGEYGLRNKRELWRYKTMLSKIRGIARSILGMSEEEREALQKEYVPRMVRLGLMSESAKIDDVLDLTIRSLLDKRLQTVVYRKGLAKTIHQARELIAHGHIIVDDRKVTVPGYIIYRNEEELVKLGSRMEAQVPLTGESETDSKS